MNNYVYVCIYIYIYTYTHIEREVEIKVEAETENLRGKLLGSNLPSPRFSLRAFGRFACTPNTHNVCQGVRAHSFGKDCRVS